MKDWTWQDIVRRSLVGAAILLLGLVIAYEDGNTLTPRSATAQSAPVPLTPTCGRRDDSVPGGGSTAHRWNPQVWNRERHWNAHPLRCLHLHRPIRERQRL